MISIPHLAPFTILLTLLALTPSPITALTSTDIRSKSVYQLVTDRFALANDSGLACSTGDRAYCGGSWKGVENHLSYIQGMGFDTIWISPIVQNIGGTTGEGQAYHGYWSLDITSLNENFGTEADLVSLITAVHAAGMYVMVDVVVNHVAATSSSTFAPDASYGPFNASSSFHPFMFVDNYANQTDVEYGWLGDTDVALPDLDTESTYVSGYYSTWIADLVKTYQIDALRIDTVKHVPQTFWPGFVSSAGVFAVGEVLSGDTTYTAAYQNNSMDGILNYPMYYQQTYAFNGSADMSALVTQINANNAAFKDTTLLGNFLECADQARFASYTSDAALIKNANAFSFATDGFPIVYYGSEQMFTGAADPENREALWSTAYSTSNTMYPFFVTLNDIRKQAGSASSTYHTSKATIAYQSTNDIALMKAPLLSVLTNRGNASSSTTFSVPTTYAANTAVTDILTCTNYTTDASSALSVTLTDGVPRMFLPAADVGTLCNSSSPIGSATTTSGGSSPTASTTGTASAGTRAAGLGMATAVIGLALAVASVTF